MLASKGFRPTWIRKVGGGSPHDLVARSRNLLPVKLLHHRIVPRPSLARLTAIHFLERCARTIVGSLLRPARSAVRVDRVSRNSHASNDLGGADEDWAPRESRPGKARQGQCLRPLTVRDTCEAGRLASDRFRMDGSARGAHRVRDSGTLAPAPVRLSRGEEGAAISLPADPAPKHEEGSHPQDYRNHARRRHRRRLCAVAAPQHLQSPPRRAARPRSSTPQSVKQVASSSNDSILLHTRICPPPTRKAARTAPFPIAPWAGTTTTTNTTATCAPSRRRSAPR